MSLVFLTLFDFFMKKCYLYHSWYKSVFGLIFKWENVIYLFLCFKIGFKLRLIILLTWHPNKTLFYILTVNFKWFIKGSNGRQWKLINLFSHFDKINDQIVATHARVDARSHQERRYAIEHVELVARRAIVFLLVLLETRKLVHAMQASEPMEINPSALENESQLHWKEGESLLLLSYII